MFYTYYEIIGQKIIRVCNNEIKCLAMVRRCFRVAWDYSKLFYCYESQGFREFFYGLCKHRAYFDIYVFTDESQHRTRFFLIVTTFLVLVFLRYDLLQNIFKTVLYFFRTNPPFLGPMNRAHLSMRIVLAIKVLPASAKLQNILELKRRQPLRCEEKANRNHFKN